jgi:FixJ family two-component response regulator
MISRDGQSAVGAKNHQGTKTSCVAVVDPDQTVRAGLDELLGDLATEICHYDSAEEFLRATAEHVPDCLITEVWLPGISGVELLERLNEAGRHVPTILLARDGDVAMAVRGIRAGAAEYIEKPYVDSRLRQSIRSILARHEIH